MLIYVNPSSGVPVYRQIVDQVKRQAAAGQLAPGCRLDSVRALAGRLGVNPMTVAKAYATLAAEGAVRARPGSGVFVASPGREELTGAARRRMLADLLDQVVAETRQLGLSPAEALDLLADRFAQSPWRATLRRGRPADGRDETRPSRSDAARAAEDESPASPARPAVEPPNEPGSSPPPPGAEEEDVALL